MEVAAPDPDRWRHRNWPCLTVIRGARRYHPKWEISDNSPSPFQTPCCLNVEILSFPLLSALNHSNQTSALLSKMTKISIIHLKGSDHHERSWRRKTNHCRHTKNPGKKCHTRIWNDVFVNTHSLNLSNTSIWAKAVLCSVVLVSSSQ